VQRDRRFRAAAAICVCALAVAVVPGLTSQRRTFHLQEATIADVQAAVESGALTYERLVQLYLNRIAAYDKQGPTLRAVIAINPHAISAARSLDEERRTKGIRSALHGIPIAVKDNIDVTEMPTTGGSTVFAGSYPAHDATVVRRLRQAGAIILVKTNMDELALGSRGLSSVGGQIRNPYDLTRNPGGSSGGTAVAVNVGFAMLGVATETGFSIRSPASNNAIVGIAPTRGLISRAGVIPISFTQDRVGVHARSVTDAALLLTFLAGFDADDLSTADSLGQSRTPSYTDLATDTGKPRIGVLRDLFRKGAQFDDAHSVIEGQIQNVSSRAVIVDGLQSGTDLVAMMPTLRLNSYELQSAFDAYLRRRGPGSPVKTFAELVATRKYPTGGTLETRFRETLGAGDPATNKEYLSRLQTQRQLRQMLIDLMDRHGVDALLYPVKSLGAPLIGTSDDGPRDNNISAITGLPAIVVPAGVNHERLPIALELLGRPFSEPRLIRVAYVFEQAMRARTRPTTTPNLSGEVFPF
jgi:Asp-tRNA(Asn)/Glu-tRNA(Gln) amidotransferase A subunit family amidase